jgi:hypothetical protein
MIRMILGYRVRAWLAPHRFPRASDEAKTPPPRL